MEKEYFVGGGNEEDAIHIRGQRNGGLVRGSEGNYLDEGRGSATCLAGLLPEDMYCFPSSVGAIFPVIDTRLRGFALTVRTLFGG